MNPFFYFLQLQQQMNFIQILLFVVLQSSINCKLIYGFSFVRHGVIYNLKDAFAGNITGPHKGELTTVGMRQMQNLGAYIRQDYIQKQGFLPEEQDNTVQFFSSSLQRTQLSAYCFLYGLYPLNTGPKVQSNINKIVLDPPFQPLFPKHLSTQPKRNDFSLRYGFSPVPVHILDQVLDSCEKIDPLEQERRGQILKSLQDISSQYLLTIERIKLIFNLPNTNDTTSTMKKLSGLYRALQVDRMIGIKLPQAYTKEDEKKLKFIEEFFSISMNQGKIGRVLATLLFQYISSKFQSVVSGSFHRKMSFIICHSSTFWPLMVNFNMTSTECITQRKNGTLPPNKNCEIPFYGSTLILELHQNDLTHNHQVKIKYQGRYMKMCAGVQQACPLQEFLQRLKNTEEDYDSQCGPRPIKGYITQKE